MENMQKFIQKSTNCIPLFISRPQAGFPSPGDEHMDTELNLHSHMVQNPTSTFFVRVEGNSMVGAGILSGDILVVDRAPVPHHNDIIVVALSGELMVKRLWEGNGVRQFLSEHEDYPPITVHEQDECFVWGVVVGSARTYR